MTERRLGDLGGAGVSPPWGTMQRQQAACAVGWKAASVLRDFFKELLVSRRPARWKA